MTRQRLSHSTPESQVTAEPRGAVTPPSGRAEAVVNPVSQAEVQPDRIKENGCAVYVDHNAKAKLVEMGYPWMGGSRYPFDAALKGWEQFDTPQDASYYGIWTSTERMATVSYSEGDVYLVMAPDETAFRDEVRSLWDWNLGYKPGWTGHTQLDSPKLTSTYLEGHPPFDQVMADYRTKEALEQQYQNLHQAAHEVLHDPTLPKGQSRVKEAAGMSFFLRQNAGDHQVICAKKTERDPAGFQYLGDPDHVMAPWAGGSDLPAKIELLQAFLEQHGQK